MSVAGPICDLGVPDTEGPVNATERREPRHGSLRCLDTGVLLFCELHDGARTLVFEIGFNNGAPRRYRTVPAGSAT